MSDYTAVEKMLQDLREDNKRLQDLATMAIATRDDALKELRLLRAIRPESYYNKRGWFLHGWLYLVLCMFCGKKLPEEE